MAQQKPPKKHRFRFFIFLTVWIFTVAAFSGVLAIQASRYNEFKAELAQKEAALEDERRAHQELIEQMDFYDSDAYIEQVAREQLGYVMPDEIIFQNEAE